MVVGGTSRASALATTSSSAAVHASDAGSACSSTVVVRGRQ